MVFLLDIFNVTSLVFITCYICSLRISPVFYFLTYVCIHIFKILGIFFIDPLKQVVLRVLLLTPLLSPWYDVIETAFGPWIPFESTGFNRKLCEKSSNRVMD